MIKRTIEDDSIRTTVIDDGGSGDSLKTTVVFELLPGGLCGYGDSPLEVSASSSAGSH